MTTLPSFLQLMSSLGLDKRTPWSSPSSSAPSSPASTAQSRSVSRDRASPSRHRVARYSPYPSLLLSTRRGSLPSTPLITSEFHKPMRAFSTSPRPLLSTASRRRNTFSISTDVYESTSDLTANTPISIYVRRKAPSLSPTSPTFLHEYSPTITPMPLSLPTLPSLFSQTDTYSVPPTPQSDIQQTTSEHNSFHSTFHSEISEKEDNLVFHYTSVQISTPTDVKQLTQVR